MFFPHIGVFPAAINATMLALIDAGIPLRDFVASCAIGVIGTGEALVGQLNCFIRMVCELT